MMLRMPRSIKLSLGIGAAGAAALALGGVIGARVRTSSQPTDDAWQTIPIAPRGSTLLGVSFRPLQVEALGLEATETLRAKMRSV